MEFRAQGATEYLVLLAVVLVIALVGIALLGFFPGTASDAQITESQLYWQSASPLAITEMGARGNLISTAYTFPYIRVRNVGQYPIRITKLLGPGSESISQIWISASLNISDYYYLAPGEEKYFARTTSWSVPVLREIDFQKGTGSGQYVLRGLTADCTANATPYGVMVMPAFGFEYVQYIEGQQITKRQVGKALVIRCLEPSS